MRAGSYPFFKRKFGIFKFPAPCPAVSMIFLVMSIIQLSVMMGPTIIRASEYKAGIDDASKQSSICDEIYDGFDHSLRVLTYGRYMDISESSQNPNNDFFQIPRYRAGLEIRPDLYLNFRRFDLSTKPRINVEWSGWADGSLEGDDDWEYDLFINEWLARASLTQSLFISYGRENLQWGPSYLVSLSNPFFEDNGRSNPKQEVAGMDFARAVWLPSSKWTLSMIANLDQGQQEILFGEFEKTYALKLDYTGYEAYSSVIISYKEDDRARLGFFGGWTATDALLLYGEGELSKGTDVLYPIEDSNHPFGSTMEPVEEDSTSLVCTMIMGGSYTTLIGSTFTMEYLYNGSGYDDDQARIYYGLRDKASDAFQGPLGDLSRYTLAQTANTGLRFLRQHYLMIQYSQTDIYDVLNMVFRWTRNLDDGSDQFLCILEYYLGDHLQLFSIGTITDGRKDTEYDTFFNSQWTIGLEYTF